MPEHEADHPRVGLRIDVCNRRALEAGVPNVLELLDRAHLKASFFVTFGPDRAGSALRRLLEPGFLSKMIRTRAWRMYGIRTLLAGTLLPARPVGEDFPEALRQIEARGHELAIHGWDHAGWLNDIERMTPPEIESALTLAREAFVEILGHAPCASGAPGWRCTEEALVLQDVEGLVYASDCRGDGPFRPRIGGRTLKTLQVPVTLPTSDELIGRVPLDRLAGECLERILTVPRGPHVLAVHAESEGGLHAGWFERFLEDAAEAGVAFEPLGLVATRWHDTAPTLDLAWRRIPGRAGRVMHAVSVHAQGSAKGHS